MYKVFENLSKYIYFRISKSITPYAFLLAFKILKSFQCILKKPSAHSIGRMGSKQRKIKNSGKTVYSGYQKEISLSVIEYAKNMIF